MPVYSYKCGDCGKVFDRFQSIGDNGNVSCDFCGGKAFRLFSPVGIIFKGSGFYTTDYGSSKSKLSGGNGKDKKSEIGDDKDKKIESKSEEAVTKNS